jgi:Na+-transporting NADH:ubiquinone oxidoreductase subunit NqrC
MNTKIVVAIALIVVTSTIIASAVFIWQIQEQLNELKRQIEIGKNVKIVDFSSPGWWNPVGVWVMADFNVTIMNNCAYDVEGVIVEIRRLDFEEDPNNITRTIGVLSAGEIISIHGTLNSGFNAFAEGSQCLVATLKVGNEIVDNRVIHLERT